MLGPRWAKLVEKYSSTRWRLIEVDACTADRATRIGDGKAGIASEAWRADATPIERSRLPASAILQTPTTGAIDIVIVSRHLLAKWLGVPPRGRVGSKANHRSAISPLRDRRRLAYHLTICRSRCPTPVQNLRGAADRAPPFDPRCPFGTCRDSRGQSLLGHRSSIAPYEAANPWSDTMLATKDDGLSTDHLNGVAISFRGLSRNRRS